MTTTARMQAAPVCRCVWMGPGASPTKRLSPSAAQAMHRRLRRHARAAPADGLMRIDIEDKWWRWELFMMEAVRGWPARA